MQGAGPADNVVGNFFKMHVTTSQATFADIFFKEEGVDQDEPELVLAGGEDQYRSFFRYHNNGYPPTTLTWFVDEEVGAGPHQ